MVAIGVSSNEWAHPATRAPPGHVQKYTCTHGKTKTLQKEQSSHLQGKISYDHCNRQVDKPPGPRSQLNEPTRRDPLNLQLAGIWGETTEPGYPDLSPQLPESISFFHSFPSINSFSASQRKPFPNSPKR